MCKDTNGCGPSKYPRLSKLIPDFCFGDCCDKHDLDYGKGGTKKEWREAELSFWICLLSAVYYRPWYSRPFYYFFAYIYSQITRAFGRSVAWKNRKDKNN